MDRSQGSLAVLIVGVLIVLGGIAYWMSLPSYGEISRKGYDFAMALGSACNGKNEAKIAKIQQMIDQSAEAGELEPHEVTWLQGIAQDATDGHWESAYASVRTLMEEQTKRASPPPPID